MKHMMIAAALFLLGAFGAEAQTTCTVDDLRGFYGKELDEEYEVGSEAQAIAEGLYRGPLMREGEPRGVGNLRSILTRQSDVDITHLQEVVRSHLYNEPEFRQRYDEMSTQHGPTRAAERIRDSIYSAFGFRDHDEDEMQRDTCLIESGQAHLVVTRAIVDYMERKDLD